MWLVYALLSAIFASLVAIFIKLGVKNIDSNLAMALRTSVVLVMAWLIVCFSGSAKNISTALTKSNLIFLVISGLATGLSWLFYIKALQLGEVAKVAPIDKLSLVLTLILAFFILGEQVTPKVIIGATLIVSGTLVMIL